MTTRRPTAPSRRSLLRAMAALPVSTLVLAEAPGLLGSAAAAAPAHGSATRYTIVPFLNSDDGTVNVYQSDDATDFRLVRAAAYTPPANRIRDASVFRHTDGYYYLTYTTHTWQDVSTTLGFARSSDRVAWEKAQSQTRTRLLVSWNHSREAVFQYLSWLHCGATPQ